VNSLTTQIVWWPLAIAIGAAAASGYFVVGAGDYWERVVISAAMIYVVVVFAIAAHREQVAPVDRTAVPPVSNGSSVGTTESELHSRRRRRRVRAWYSAGGAAVLFVAITIALFADSVRPLAYSLATVLGLLSLMLFGYAVNFRLFAVISVAPRPVKRN